MNKIIKISSLGLVALLAGCGNKVAPLKRISPSDAISVSASIMGQRLQDRKKLALIDKDTAQNNPLFTNTNPLYPFLSKKMSADITIKHNSSYNIPVAPNLNLDEAITIKKHLFFDLEHLYFHSYIEMKRETSEGVKYNYPSAHYYAFFIEDEKQEEGIESEYGKTGGFFSLINCGDLMKSTHANHVSADNGTRLEFITSAISQLLIDNSPIITDIDAFNEENALSLGLFSVTNNWGALNYYLTNPIPTSDTVFQMRNWMYNFNNVVNACKDAKDELEALEKNNTYFNYGFKSADAASLSLETDLSYDDTNEAQGIYGITTQTSSITFRDSYLSESHIALKRDHEAKMNGVTYYTNKASTSIDQTINYHPGDGVEIPSDYLNYYTPA